MRSDYPSFLLIRPSAFFPLASKPLEPPSPFAVPLRSCPPKSHTLSRDPPPPDTAPKPPPLRSGPRLGALLSRKLHQDGRAGTHRRSAVTCADNGFPLPPPSSTALDRTHLDSAPARTYLSAIACEATCLAAASSLPTRYDSHRTVQRGAATRLPTARTTRSLWAGPAGSLRASFSTGEGGRQVEDLNNHVHPGRPSALRDLGTNRTYAGHGEGYPVRSLHAVDRRALNHHPLVQWPSAA